MGAEASGRREHPENTGIRKSYIEVLNKTFEHIGGWSYDHRWIVLAGSLAILTACTVFASRVRFDNSFEAYFDRQNPLYTTYLRYRDDFGSDEISYILYEAPTFRHGPWNLAVMRKIASLTEALESEVPFVKEVTSLTNVEFMEGVPDGLKIYKLLDEFPKTQAELLEVRKKVLAKPMYVGGLVSRDAKYAAILVAMDKSSIDTLDEIRLDPKGGNGLDNLYPQATYKKIEEILARPEYKGILFYHTGDVPLNAVYNIITASESWQLGGICVLVIGALLFFFFRKPIGVLGPIAVVILAVLVSVATVGMIGWNLDLTFSILPTLLIAVGVADSVHIIAEFRAGHAALGDGRKAMRRTMYLVGTPCLLTSLTTAAGFGSMYVSSIKSISRFSVYSAVGVAAAFVLSITLLMFFLSLGHDASGRTAAEQEERQAKGGERFRTALEAVARFDIRHSKSILLVFMVVLIFAALGIPRIAVDSNFLTDFSEDVPIRRTTILADNTMGGTASFIYLFDTGVADGIKNPAVLREIERLQAEAERYDYLVMKTYSIVDILKDINQSFHGGDPSYRVLPSTRELIAQYLLLYEMSGGENLEDYVSGDLSRASLEIRCKMIETSQFARMEKSLNSYLRASPLSSSTASVTGIAALWVKLMDYITSSQIRGFLLAFTVIAAMMCFVLKSVKTGMLSMIPNLLPVLLTLGGMGWLGIPLDYTRLLIGTVAIGIAVDDTIHLVTRYRHEFIRCGDYNQALCASMKDVGRALFITSIVLVAGFLVFLFSVMDSQASFGLLLGGTITVALAADFFLMPALVLTVKPFGADRHVGPDVPSAQADRGPVIADESA